MTTPLRRDATHRDALRPSLRSRNALLPGETRAGLRNFMDHIRAELSRATPNGKSRPTKCPSGASASLRRRRR
jgi:hypothetical protein